MRRRLFGLSGFLAVLAALSVFSQVTFAAGPTPKECVPLQKSFYLTTSARQGWDTASACAVGFHIPSLWELSFFEGYAYNDLLGEPGASPYTPPLRTGWIVNDCESIHPNRNGRVGYFNWENSQYPYGLFEWGHSNLSTECLALRQVWCFSDPVY